MASLSSAPTYTVEASHDLFCITCGYNQRGIIANRCPECGQDFSIVPPSATRLPWAHRRHLGLLGAYWRTLLMVLFRPHLFCEQIDNPITFKDARVFWLMTVLLAYIPLLGAGMQLHYTPTQPGSIIGAIQLMFVPSFSPVAIGDFMLVGLLLFILFASGMPSYFCHPKTLSIERQNRAIALSYFACAPLGVMPLVIAPILIAQLMAHFTAIALALRIAAGLFAFGMLATWAGGTTRIVTALSQSSDRFQTRKFLMISWLVLMFIFLLIFPIILQYSWLMLRIIFL
jgi:hypothetical protein